MHRHSHVTLRLFAWIWVVWSCCAGAQVSADVVVVANRTTDSVEFNARIDDVPVRKIKLAPGDSAPLFAAAGVHVSIIEGNFSSAEQLLAPNAAYAFVPSVAGGAPTLKPLKLGESSESSWPAVATPPLELFDSNVITVKVVVDDDEVRQRQVWEPVIRERIDKASAALEAHCGMKLRVVAIEEWDSDDDQRDFFQTLSEFEREVLSAPADVAIAFSSQYDIATGRVHLGGTRQPLHSHILLKERSRNVLEPERTELLAH